MPALTQLKKEIQFNGRLNGLLDVMKSISAQQFQVLEATLKANPQFFDVIQAIAGTFDLEHFSHPFTQDLGPIGIIAVTSDAGLLGGLNQQVITAAMREYRREPGEMIVIGKRGISYLQEYKLSCREFPAAQEETRRTLAGEVRDYVLNQVLEGRFGRLTIVYPKAISFTVQRVEAIRALPCQAWLRDKPRQGPLVSGHVMLESSSASLLEYLVWLWVSGKLFEVFAPLKSRLKS
jgi:F0F1-type ATP synthase gamma subunit